METHMTNPVPAPVDAGVAVVRWPYDAAGRVRARATGTPRLLLIDPGTAPPSDCALDEDWTTTAAPPADVAARLAALATRPSRRHRLPVDRRRRPRRRRHRRLRRCSPSGRRARRRSSRSATRVGPAGDLAATLRRLRRALGATGADVVTVQPAACAAASATQRTR